MARKKTKGRSSFLDSETGTIRKDNRGRIKVILVYPNTYYVGMSNLGFLTVYRLLNKIENIVCERCFLPEPDGGQTNKISTIESGMSVSECDVLAFSVSFENDYPYILKILCKAGLPLLSSARGDPHPLLIAGGVACFLNPESIAPFMDCILIGEAEVLLPRFFHIFDTKMPRKPLLVSLARNVPGVYVPAFYEPSYNKDGTLRSFDPILDVPKKIERQVLEDISTTSTCSPILTSHTSFDNTYLIEVSRGCPHGCRFCSAGYIYRPPRFTSAKRLRKCIQDGILLTNKIGFVGAAVSDFPDLNGLCSQFRSEEIKFSFSSLRADAINEEVVKTLFKSGVKTASLAPDAGSQRMRNVINKGITEEDILNAAEMLVAGGVQNLKMYFMIGLPYETTDDIEAIVKLCKQIKHRFLKSSRTRKRIGTLTLSINSFVPKPMTPFQWVAMDEVTRLKKKIKRIKNGLKGIGNLKVHADIPRWAFIQALFARGDRKVANILLLANKNRENWPKTFKETSLNPFFYTLRQRPLEEVLPWDFIDHKIKKSFLKKEFQKALKENTTPGCEMGTCRACGVCDDSAADL